MRLEYEDIERFNFRILNLTRVSLQKNKEFSTFYQKRSEKSQQDKENYLFLYVYKVHISVTLLGTNYTPVESLK